MNVDNIKSNLKNNMNKYAFIGDSPNDEPMFSYFPLSFGVANVMRFIDDMKSRPAIICHEAGGAIRVFHDLKLSSGFQVVRISLLQSSPDRWENFPPGGPPVDDKKC